ncbi:hypothetical protein R1sor_011798 [Riccia sorocarpa]|uniref:Uncharacterized protein n=1 Tax=Riccia sorocarpa TaxID=122646 RepID=A0ABD3I5W6_9MARC
MWNFFCSGHGKGQFEACERQEWVTEWDFRSLVLSPTGVQSVHDITLADEFHAGADHEVMSDTLAVGDVFAVKGSFDEEAQTEYWLLRCTGTKQKITEKEVSCPWNTEQVFTRDEVAVFGRYLEFQKKFKGPNETHEQILMAISEVEAPIFERL